jgi:hypothetical protein
MEVPLGAARTPSELVVARQVVDLLYAVSRYLIGDELADGLGYPRTPWRLAVGPIRAMNVTMNALRRSVTSSHEPLYRFGLFAWERLIEQGLAGIPAAFDFRGASVGQHGGSHAQ